MKRLLLLIILFVSIQSFGQTKNDSLVTSIGWVIKQGDVLKLGIGSMDNGNFAFISASEAAQLGDGKLTHRFANKEYEVYKIKVFRGRQIPVIKLSNLLGIGNRMDVEIEGAIKSGEVIVPEQFRKKKESTPPASVADELAKLKKLYDDGILTKEEFEAQKKKLLNQ